MLWLPLLCNCMLLHACQVTPICHLSWLLPLQGLQIAASSCGVIVRVSLDSDMVAGAAAAAATSRPPQLRQQTLSLSSSAQLPLFATWLLLLLLIMLPLMRHAAAAAACLLLLQLLQLHACCRCCKAPTCSSGRTSSCSSPKLFVEPACSNSLLLSASCRDGASYMLWRVCTHVCIWRL